MNGFIFAALVRFGLLGVVPLALYWLLVRPVTSPLHQFAAPLGVVLVVLLVWLVLSTLARYSLRRSGRLEVVVPDDSEPETVSLRR